MPDRNDLKLQFGTAAKPTGEPREEFREQRLHAGDTTAGRNKSPDFSTLSEFLVGTGDSMNEVQAFLLIQGIEWRSFAQISKGPWTISFPTRRRRSSKG